MTEEMILKRAHKDIEALSTLLGTNKFLVGDKPCTADAAVFGCLHGLINSGVDSPLAKIVNEHKNLVEYVQRNLDTYWAKESEQS